MWIPWWKILKIQGNLLEKRCYLAYWELCSFAAIDKLWNTSYTTQNMLFSVWLYLVLLPPYHAQQWFSILWQLVLDINVPLPSLFPPLLFIYIYILTNAKFKHVTSTYYHSWYLVYAFIFSVSNTKYHILCSTNYAPKIWSWHRLWLFWPT